MIIVVGKWKQKVMKFAAVIVLIIAFAAVVPVVTGMFYEKVPVFSGWVDDEHPSGNPMRVEKNLDNKLQEENDFNQKLDRFVVKVQNFYYEEKE